LLVVSRCRALEQSRTLAQSFSHTSETGLCKRGQAPEQEIHTHPGPVGELGDADIQPGSGRVFIN
jgi:hypothetical protein